MNIKFTKIEQVEMKIEEEHVTTNPNFWGSPVICEITEEEDADKK